MGLGPKAFRKLQSCLVAAEAACSRGDFPVVTVEIALAAVEGLATATDTAAVPAELATLVAELPKAIKGAAHPVKLRQRALRPKKKKAGQTKKFDLLDIAIKSNELFTFASNVKDTCCP